MFPEHGDSEAVTRRGNDADAASFGLPLPNAAQPPLTISIGDRAAGVADICGRVQIVVPGHQPKRPPFHALPRHP